MIPSYLSVSMVSGYAFTNKLLIFHINTPTVVVICPPTIGRRMTVLTIVTTEAAEIAAMEDAVVEDVEEMMEVAETVEVEEADTPRTGPSPWPGTRGWRRSSSTLNTVIQGSTLKGKKSISEDSGGS